MGINETLQNSMAINEVYENSWCEHAPGSHAMIVSISLHTYVFNHASDPPRHLKHRRFSAATHEHSQVRMHMCACTHTCDHPRSSYRLGLTRAHRLSSSLEGEQTVAIKPCPISPLLSRPIALFAFEPPVPERRGLPA